VFIVESAVCTRQDKLIQTKLVFTLVKNWKEGELDWSHFASKLPSTTGYWRKKT